MRPPRTWQEMIEDWAPELSAKLGRSISEIETKGLVATDFSPSTFVEIRDPAGMTTRFSFAFALIRSKKSVAAVFSEHYGYMEFDLIEDSIVAEIHEDIYTHWGES